MIITFCLNLLSWTGTRLFSLPKGRLHLFPVLKKFAFKFFEFLFWFPPNSDFLKSDILLALMDPFVWSLSTVTCSLSIISIKSYIFPYQITLPVQKTQLSELRAGLNWRFLSCLLKFFNLAKHVIYKVNHPLEECILYKVGWNKSYLILSMGDDLNI